MSRKTLKPIVNRCVCGHPLTPEHLRELHRGIKNRDDTIRKRNRRLREMERETGVKAFASKKGSE